MRLFRQEQRGDWTAVLSRVKRELLQIALGMCDAGSFQRAAPKTALTKSSLNKRDELSIAIRLHEGKNWNKAEQTYRNIIASDPDHFDGLHLLGVLLHQQGRNREAIELIVRALQRKPNEAVALTNYGAVLDSEGRFDEALVVYDRALKIKPDYPPALFNRARALKELNRNEEALADYLQVTVLDPGNAEAFYNRANLLLNLNRFAEALADYDRAIALKNGYHKAYTNRALVQMKLEQIEPAIDSLTKAIALESKNAVTWSNRGAALMELGRIEEAVDDYNQAIALNPEDADAHHNRALAYLSLGRFERGWRDYDWRWETEQLRCKRHRFLGPIWSGTEAIAGKTVLLYEEQGLGDTIQFCRFVPLVAEQNARIVLAVPPALKGLLAGLPGASVVLTDGDRLPAFDLHCPLLSLPRAFGTRLETIPAPVQLNVPADLLQKWKSKLGERDRLRVGLAWAGNAIHRNDKNRSIPLTALLSLRELPIQLISLQKEVRSGDQDVLAAHPDILHFGSELMDLAETAAVISALDLVISVDTAVAHLAATLGQKTWIMIPFASDWRWLFNRNDSPWYPSVRLFRQQARRDWKPVVSMVEDQLKVLIA
jgi:tetratricopeptide (TPR) repeat protein